MGLRAQPSIILLNAAETTDPRCISRVSRQSAAFSQRSTKPLTRFSGRNRLFAVQTL
jgi:hypothetical protein